MFLHFFVFLQISKTCSLTFPTRTNTHEKARHFLPFNFITVWKFSEQQTIKWLQIHTNDISLDFICIGIVFIFYLFCVLVKQCLTTLISRNCILSNMSLVFVAFSGTSTPNDFFQHQTVFFFSICSHVMLYSCTYSIK